MQVNFQRLTWEDYPSEQTPLSAENLNRLEEGVAGLYSDMAGIEEGIDSFKDETSAQVESMQDRLTTMEGDIDSFEEITLGQVGSMQTRVTSMENGLPTMVGEQIDNKFGDDIGDNVTDWLTEHVTPSGSAVVVDDTLTIAGAAADAKKTGDEIFGLKEDLNINYALSIRTALYNSNMFEGIQYADRTRNSLQLKKQYYSGILMNGTMKNSTTYSITDSDKGFSLTQGTTYTLFVKIHKDSPLYNNEYQRLFPVITMRDGNDAYITSNGANVEIRDANSAFTFVPDKDADKVYLNMWHNKGSDISLYNEILTIYLVMGECDDLYFVDKQEQNDYVTPEQFGAIGDGITDDTLAWTKAVAFGRRVKATKNRYKCGKIIVNHDVDIDCNGAIFICTALVLFECNGEEVSHSNQSKYTRNSIYRLSGDYETYTGLAYIKGNNNLFKQRNYYVGGFIEHFNNGWLVRTQPFDVTDPVVYCINPISVNLKNIGNVTFSNPENSYVIKQMYCEKSHISNINMTNVCYSVVCFEKCYSCIVENCHIDIPIYTYANNNYPIGYDDSYYITIKGIYCHNATWHCISGGGYTVNRGAKIEDCILASDGLAPAIGDHENCIGTNVIGTDATSITVGLLSVISNCTIHPKNDSSVCRISLMLCSKQGTSEDEAFSMAKYAINDVLFDVRRTGNNISSQCSIYLLCSPQSESGYSAEYGFEKIILSNVTKSNDHLHTSAINDGGVVDRVYTDGSVKYGRTVIMNSDFTALYPKDAQGHAINIKFPDDFIEI